jgi:hypothetical protein
MKRGESSLIIILDGIIFYIIRTSKDNFFNIGKFLISDYLFPSVIPVKGWIPVFSRRSGHRLVSA